MTTIINTLTLMASMYVTDVRKELKEREHADSTTYYETFYPNTPLPEAKAADSALFRKLDGRTYISFEQRKCIKEHYSKQVKK